MPSHQSISRIITAYYNTGMDLLWKTLIVFALGIIELWGAIPAGFALGLNPWVTGIASSAGALAGVCLVVFLGERVRSWVLEHRGGKSKTEGGRVRRIWDRYGVIGLGLVAPLLTGAPLGAALGLAFGASPKRVFVWIGVGVALWTVILTAAAATGLELIT